MLVVGSCRAGDRFLLLATVEVDNLQFDRSLGTSVIGKAGLAMAEVVAAEGVKVLVSIFLVHGLLEVSMRKAEAGEGERSVGCLEVG